MATRGAAWSDAEVNTLIALWGDRHVQEQIQGSVRNNHIYKKMSKDMKEKGFTRDAEQCKAKIKNLKTEYRQAKDNNDKTGRGRKTFKHYDEFLATDQHPDHQWFLMPQQEGSLLSPVRRERETALTMTAVRQ